jgi:LysR family glycine cleavage system transcriptional activator
MQRKLPPLNAVKTFEAAARLSSFSKAADELCVTHGAVSQQIKTLEEHFGCQLFTRIRGRVILNPAGSALLKVATEALNRLDEVSAQLVQAKQTEILTVNVTTCFASHWLLPRLKDFQLKHPQITLKISPSSSFATDLSAGVDVAIRWGASDIDGLTKEPLIDVDSFVACAPSLLRQDPKLDVPQDIVHHNLIHDDDGQAWSALLAELSVEGVDHNKGSFYADSGLALQAAVEGDGLIVAGNILAEQDLQAGRLVIPFDLFIAHRKSYYLYYSKHCGRLHKVEIFRRWLFGQIEDYKNQSFDYSQYMA